MRCGKGQLAAIGGLNVKKIIRFERFTNSSLRLCRRYLTSRVIVVVIWTSELVYKMSAFKFCYFPYFRGRSLALDFSRSTERRTPASSCSSNFERTDKRTSFV